MATSGKNEEGTHWQLLDEGEGVVASIPANESVNFYSLSVALILAAYELNHENVTITEDRLIINDGKRDIVNAPLFGGQTIEINWFSKWKGRLWISKPWILTVIAMRKNTVSSSNPPKLPSKGARTGL